MADDLVTPGATTTEHAQASKLGIGALFTAFGSVFAMIASVSAGRPELVYPLCAIVALSLIVWCAISIAYIWSRTRVKQAALAAGKAVVLAVAFGLIGLAGCEHKEASATTTRIEKSLIKHEADTNAGIARLHEKIRTTLRAAADAQYAAAVKSITDAGGKADTQEMQALQNLRLGQYEAIEAEIQISMGYFAASDVNAANALTDLQNLDKYFEVSAQNSAAISGSVNDIIKMLQQLRASKK